MRHTNGRSRTAATAAMTSVLALVLAACGGGSGEIQVTDAWARSSPAMATAGAAYMEISNETDQADTLVGAGVDPSVAVAVEIHETTTDDSHSDHDDHDSHGGDGAMMHMHAVDRIDVAAGGSVSLEPGGYHVMLLDLAEPLEAGSTVTVTLTFETAGDIEVTADVRDTAP